jgi:hypothetical protein
MKIYNNQSAIRLSCMTTTDLTSAEDTVIKYKSPNGYEGSFVASIANTEIGILEYSFVLGQSFETIDQNGDGIGEWTIWAHVVFTDGREAPGEVYKLRVYEEGE